MTDPPPLSPAVHHQRVSPFPPRVSTPSCRIPAPPPPPLLYFPPNLPPKWQRPWKLGQRPIPTPQCERLRNRRTNICAQDCWQTVRAERNNTLRTWVDF